MKKVLIYLLFVFINSGLLSAQTGGQILFQSPGKDGHPYRIPALTTLHNGHILAVADFRWCNADIGNGHVDIVGRISKDNGNSWGQEFTLARGSGINGAHDCGYGDAAIVTDRETGRVLLMCCTGDVFYTFSSRSNPLRAARLYSDDKLCGDESANGTVVLGNGIRKHRKNGTEHRRAVCNPYQRNGQPGLS